MALTTTTNTQVYLFADDLELITTLDRARLQANGIDLQSNGHGTYGLIQTALIEALRQAILSGQRNQFDDVEAGVLAETLYEQGLLDGMSVREAVEAWNTNRITLEV